MAKFTATYASGCTELVEARNFYEAANLLRHLRPREVIVSLVVLMPFTAAAHTEALNVARNLRHTYVRANVVNVVD